MRTAWIIHISLLGDLNVLENVIDEASVFEG
jgi:hypothetical protein